MVSPKSRRDSTRVIYDILNLANYKVRKTRIIYEANLNFNFAKPYLQFLISKGFMFQDQRFYELTKEGRNLLDLLEKVENSLDGLFDYLERPGNLGRSVGFPARKASNRIVGQAIDVP